MELAQELPDTTTSLGEETGTGGPQVYEGQDMLSAHKGMNISNDEFVAVLDDAMEALEKNGIGQREKEEVLSIFFSMKGDIVHV